MNFPQSIIEKIKQKKELRGLADDFVQKELESYAKKNPHASQKDIIKGVRAELRKSTGRFNSGKRNKLLEEKNYEELLKTHASTRERLPHYNVLKEIIKNLNPKSILDIGCGLNPIALATQGIVYHASDIKQDELNLVKEFFRQNHIKGQVFYADARTERNFPQADVSLLLKIVDLLDKKGHKTAESLLSSLNCRHVIVSFSTKTLSGRPMNHPQRGWIEHLAKRLGYTFTLVKTPNELFYLINK